MKLEKWNIHRLNEVVNLWNQELYWDFPMRKKLFKQNSFDDENVCFESSKIAVNDKDEVIGFIVAKRWQEAINVHINQEGWIQVLLVDRNYRNRGIGTRLLAHAEQVLKKKGIKRILLGKDPWHYFPGVPKQYSDVCSWFEGKGYRHFGTEYDMINEYKKTYHLSIPQAQDARYSLLTKAEKQPFIQFLRRCFPGRWEYEAEKYFQKGGTGREFVILKKRGEIIGFSRINDINSPFIAQNVYWSPLFKDELGGIGPLGIDYHERGNGYGLGIVKAAIAMLRNRGIKKIVIDWTGLINFYRRLGFHKWKSYESYKKQIEN